MRKVKHFAGYGTVMMGKVNDGAARLHVRVEGNHEQGIVLDRWQDDTMFRWIVSRYVKDLTWADWYNLRPVIGIADGFRDDPKLGYIDTCDYYFTW